MLKKTIAILACIGSVHGKVVTVGSGKQYPSVNLAVRSSVPLDEDLYVLVEVPTGKYAATDAVDPNVISGFNGFKVVIKGFKHIPKATAYVEDEAVYDTDGDGFQETYLNIKGKDGVEGRTEGSSTVYYAKDHLGSTRQAVLVDSRTTKEANAYYSYGNLKSVVNSPEPVKEKFTGKELDGEMALFYFGARYYNADLGMWISPDRAHQFNGGYSYDPNPIRKIDPDGNVSMEGAIRYLGINPRNNQLVEPGPYEATPYCELSQDLGGEINLGLVKFQGSFMKETVSYLPLKDTPEYSQGFGLSFPFLKKGFFGFGAERKADRQQDVVKAPWIPFWKNGYGDAQADGHMGEPIKIGLGISEPLVGLEIGIQFSKRKE